jgi:hypothetical protein
MLLSVIQMMCIIILLLSSITRTDSIEDLGVFIDAKLHFLDHVNYILSLIVLSYWV